MRWTVLVQVGNTLPVDVPPSAQERTLTFGLDSSAEVGRIKQNAWEILDRALIQNSPDVAVDLFRFAAAVYAADLRIPRSETADQWTREINLHLPVSSVDRWQAAIEPATELLRFLTGDVWTLNLHEGASGRPPVNDRLKLRYLQVEATAVCLFSGGLDSFVGASDALAESNKLYLVSHSGADGGATATPVQEKLAGKIARKYGDGAAVHLPFRVSAPTMTDLKRAGLPAFKEGSTRSRSIIFLALGTLVSESLASANRLLVPENGFITINPPLTTSRLGSHSTRTTHPFTMGRYRALLDALGLNSSVCLPYRFKTKGEMILDAVDSTWVRRNANHTFSCGRANSARILAHALHKRGVQSTKATQCGHCVPCIVRRAALHKAGLTGGQYVVKTLKEADIIALAGTATGRTDRIDDLRAFKIAVQRGISLPDILSTGPIPPEDGRSYLDVAKRGLDEVDQII